MVLKNKLFLIVFFCYLIFANISISSQIFDYETEVFVNKLLNKIKEVNKFKKDIKINVIRDDNPNAFVVTKNRMIISSGLIEQAPDYVSLLAVLAHEVGHLHYFHLEKEENSLEQLSKLNLLTNLAAITGSILADEPQILAGSIASKANINNFYLSFSREQEREADLYSIETLQKLKLPSNSVKELLKILEQNALSKGFDEEYQKFSTHPIFKERYQIIDNNALNEKFNYNENTQNEFNFIKAKFLGFNDKSSFGALKNDHKIYFESINNSKTGNLQSSLKKINFLIKKYPEYLFLLETKGDILRSHGFVSESLEFYKIVLKKYPNNHYIKYRIFLDTNIKKIEKNEKNNFFENNLNLLIQFPRNKYIINKFIEIAIILDKEYWIDFLNIINQSNEFKKQDFKEKLFTLSEKTNDKKLKKIIYEYIKI